MSDWAALDCKRDALVALRRTRPTASAALDAWYDLELTYTSNAIEGNTLTRAETALVLDKGLGVSGKPLRDQMEAVDHKEALALAQSVAASGAALGEATVVALHAAVVRRTLPEDAGVYSRHQRRIRGSVAVFPSPAKIPALMNALGAWLAEATPTAANAVEAHWRLVAIHPFSDGNGRTARLLANLMLARGGYAPLVVGPEHRTAYLDALEKRQLDDASSDYARFMASRLDAALDDQIANLGESLEGRAG